MSDRTFTISDIDGKNRRTVTLAQFRAELDAAHAAAAPVAEALRRGDLNACAKAQEECRRQSVARVKGYATQSRRTLGRTA